MAKWYDGSEEFYEMMEERMEKEKLEEEIRMNKEAEDRAIDMESGEDIEEMLADQMLEDVKLAENEQ